jgi:hypothetical protein
MKRKANSWNRQRKAINAIARECVAVLVAELRSGEFPQWWDQEEFCVAFAAVATRAAYDTDIRRRATTKRANHVRCTLKRVLGLELDGVPRVFRKRYRSS